MRYLAGLALVFLAASAGFSGGARLAAADGPAEHARRILADGRFQRTLPAPASGDEARSGPRQGYRRSTPILPPGSGLAAGLIVKILGAVALLLLLMAVVNALLGRFRPSPVAAAGLPASAEPNAGEVPDAGALAEAGRYGEAVHALLLAAIFHFERRLPNALPPSRTSRELARLLPLHPDARPAFNDLVRLVEGWLFGGGTLSREDFARGTELYRAVTGRAA